MRRKIIAGNWKMNNTGLEAKQLTSEIVNMVKAEVRTQPTIILIPSFVYLPAVGELIVSGPKNIFMGAQQCSMFDSGAYTGDISASMLADIGASFVIVGHSERRHYFHETNAELAQKVTRIFENNMEPIYCCGETKDERNRGEYLNVVTRQLEEGLFHIPLSEAGRLVIAYEPVWAIGTGQTASPEQAQEMHAFIRNLLNRKYGTVSNSISILYGGSCNEQNAAELFALPDIDGGLIGGASLKSRSFINIIKSLP